MKTIQQNASSKVVLLKIPSGEDIIVGRMFVTEGEDPHPTIILLHGFPGVMMNIDLAHELQQKGWNVLVINYRGTWGSKGSFSYTNSIEDVHASIRYIRQSEIAKENRVDVNRIALVGHSFGGFLALKAASQDTSINTVVSLSGANFGLFVQMIDQNPTFEAQIFEMIKESLFFLNGCSPETIMEEVRKNKNEWNTFLFAHTLVNRNLLLTAATQDEELPKEYFHDPLVQIFESTNAKQFQQIIFDTDHGYTNIRKELVLTLHKWLSNKL